MRQQWTNLNGEWEFAIDTHGRWETASAVDWDRSIEVPFAPETPLSKVNLKRGLFKRVWYRREFETPKVARDQRVILHFGAVDFDATVWVNDCLAVRHSGGYTPFSADITDLLSNGKSQTIIIAR